MLAVDVPRPPHLHTPSSPPIQHSYYNCSQHEPAFIILPDLVAYCPFPLSKQPSADVIMTQSTKWLVDGCPGSSPRRRAALESLKAGQLTALCYPYAPDEKFRVICDFIGFLFHLDDISDGMMKKDTAILGNMVMNALWFPEQYIPCHKQPKEEGSAGQLARDFWRRCTSSAAPAVQHRFKEKFGLFFEAVHDEASDRDIGAVPDLDKYIPLRRDNGGCKAVFALIEYGLGMELPEFVVEHPAIQTLEQETNDFVAWSNDIYSWNVEQARGDTTNMVIVVMTHHKLSTQQAIDYVGFLCCRAIDKFIENKARVPRWGDEKLDRNVQAYIKGLEDWIVGSLHFNFLTDRYFGTDGETVKKTRLVKIMQKSPPK